MTGRGPREIMEEVRRDWRTPFFGAVPYISALSTLPDWESRYGCDDARSLGLYFLANASGWRGEVARRVKKEIKEAVI